MRLQDPAYTHVVLVTLAETTPVSQASALQEDLRRAHIEPYAWVVNKSLLAAGTRDPLLRQRLRGEQKQIDRVRGSMAKRVFFLPWQATPPVGLPALQELARAARREQHGAYPGGGGRAQELRGDEAGHMVDRDAGEGRREAARQGHGWIGEGGRRREPVGGRDGEADEPGDRLRRMTDAAEDREDQGEGGHGLRQPLRWAAPGGGADRERGEIEHHLRNRRAADAGKALHDDVGRDLAPGEFAAAGKNQGDGGIEMGARERSENGDQHDQDRAGGNGVAEKRDRHVPAGEALGHDPAADDGGDQERGAEAFGQ